MIQQLINDEKFTNVQKVQAGVTKLFAQASKGRHFYRVMKNDIPLGVIIPNDLWEELSEDLEALSSPIYLKSIVKSRQEAKEDKTFTLAEIENEFGL